MISLLRIGTGKVVAAVKTSFLPVVLLAGVSTTLSAEPVEIALTKKTTGTEVEAILASVSNWGRWGKDDELGTLNLITSQKRIQAARLVKEGVSVSMAHDGIKEPFDGSKPFEHEIMINDPTGDVGGAGDRYSVRYHGFAHTHLDAFCHIFCLVRRMDG